MKNKLNNSLMVLESERDQIKIRLKEQIRSIRHSLNNLESNLDSNETIYESAGLQGNAIHLDVYLGKLVSYDRAIKLFKTHIDEGV